MGARFTGSYIAQTAALACAKVGAAHIVVMGRTSITLYHVKALVSKPLKGNVVALIRRSESIPGHGQPKLYGWSPVIPYLPHD